MDMKFSVLFFKFFDTIIYKLIRKIFFVMLFKLKFFFENVYLFCKITFLAALGFRLKAIPSHLTDSKVNFTQLLDLVRDGNKAYVF